MTTASISTAYYLLLPDLPSDRAATYCSRCSACGRTPEWSGSLIFGALRLISALDREGRTIWIADAHRADGKRFVMRADEKGTAFVELESATLALRACETFFRVKSRPPVTVSLVRTEGETGSGFAMPVDLFGEPLKPFPIFF